MASRNFFDEISPLAICTQSGLPTERPTMRLFRPEEKTQIHIAHNLTTASLGVVFCSLSCRPVTLD